MVGEQDEEMILDDRICVRTHVRTVHVRTVLPVVRGTLVLDSTGQQ